jgi:ComF family protein
LTYTVSDIFDFFLPRTCVSCKSNLNSSEEIICSKCKSLLLPVEDVKIQSEFDRKFKSENLISGFTSLYIFFDKTPIQDLLHELKYNGKFRTGTYIGKEIYNYQFEKLLNWQIDFIIPVPLYPLKKAERGYNQSYFIAKGIAGKLKIPVSDGLLLRNRHTQSQTKLNFEQRKQNMEAAFSIKKFDKIKEKNILLIDDVITTGATISECARELKNNGAGDIYAASASLTN